MADNPAQYQSPPESVALTRETLLRENYRLNHELGYVGFRHQYFNDPAAIEEWPDPAVRGIELRDFWETGGCDSVGEGFASYRESHAHATVEVLIAYRDYLRGLLAGDRDGQIAYYKHVSAAGRSVRLHENGFGEVNTAAKFLPSPGELAEDRDGPEPPEPERGHDKERGR